MLCCILGDLKENYSPLYFLASLGAGGLSISFYMYLHWMVQHPGSPLATADYLFPIIKKWELTSFLILLDLVVIVYLAYLHFRLLLWNIFEYLKFKESSGYTSLKSSNAEVTIMAAPLTFAMTINVIFVLGAVFIPGLWDIIEYLFPISIFAFFVVGVVALVIYIPFITRIISTPSFSFPKNNNLSQLIAPFAFSMVAVGFSAPGAMSHHLTTSAVGLFLALFFLIITIILTLIILNFGYDSILKYGLDPSAGVSLLTIIPILTLIGITIYRSSYGFIHNFGSTSSKSFFFILTSSIEVFQIFFIIVGLAIIIKMEYLTNFVFGKTKNVSAFGIICPGVAFVVFGFFFLNGGLVNANIFPKFSLPYYLILGVFSLVQLGIGVVMLILNQKMFSNQVDTLDE